MLPTRAFPPPNAQQLLNLQHRRSELENAIRLLEEIRTIREKRTPEVTAILSKVRRVA